MAFLHCQLIQKLRFVDIFIAANFFFLPSRSYAAFSNQIWTLIFQTERFGVICSTRTELGTHRKHGTHIRSHVSVLGMQQLVWSFSPTAQMTKINAVSPSYIHTESFRVRLWHEAKENAAVFLLSKLKDCLYRVKWFSLIHM